MNLEMILKFSSFVHKQSSNGQMGLFGTEITQSISSLNLVEAEPASKKQKLVWEKELLGIYVSQHPLDDMKHILLKKAPAISSLHASTEGKRVKAAGIISSIKKIITKNGEPMLFVKLEDTTGQVEVLVFPKLLRQNSLIWQRENVIIVEGKLNIKDGFPKILADTVSELNEQTTIPLSNTNDLIISIENGANKEILQKIKTVLLKYPGEVRAVLKLWQNNEFKEIDTKLNIKICDESVNELKIIVGANNISY